MLRTAEWQLEARAGTCDNHERRRMPALPLYRIVSNKTLSTQRDLELGASVDKVTPFSTAKQKSVEVVGAE